MGAALADDTEHDNVPLSDPSEAPEDKADDIMSRIAETLESADAPIDAPADTFVAAQESSADVVDTQAAAAQLAAESVTTDAPEIDLSGLDLAEAPQEAIVAETPVAEQVVATEEPTPVPAPERDDSGIAAKLARIRAVVGQPQTLEVSGSESSYADDEYADDALDDLPGDTDLADIVPGFGNDKKETARPTSPSFDETQDATAQDPAKADVSSVAEAPVVEPARPLRARVMKVKRKEFEAALQRGELEEVADEEPPIAPTPAAPAVQESVSPAVQQVETPETIASAATSSGLSPEDEAELQRELAAVEAELAGLDSSETISPEPEPEPEPDATKTTDADEALNAPAELGQPPEVEMERLMTQATDELEEPQGKQRRSAMGHLRAAVAAARGQSADAEKTDDTEAYREDLDNAMRPRRPVRLARTQRVAQTPAPLKLVAEQRVDVDDSDEPQTPAPAKPAAAETPAPTDVKPARPVRPTRPRPATKPAAVQAPAEPEPMRMVAPAPEAAEGAAQDTFNEFAEEMGATELPDLLEAAAAYLAYVEGREQFSRPQLMTKVRMVQAENFSREDGLRTFGQLLRQGKIEKISGGRFTVSDRISFKPDARAAG